MSPGDARRLSVGSPRAELLVISSHALTKIADCPWL